MTRTWRPRAAAADRPGAAPVPWLAALASGAAVLLAAAPVTTLVVGRAWFGPAAAVVAAVVVAGLLLHRCPPLVVTLGQCSAGLALLTSAFTRSGVLGVLPGPAALRELGASIVEAGRQIEVQLAPVPPTPAILMLVTAALGLLAVAVHLAAVGAAAPAVAGVPLLAVFAVPAALADGLLPVWTTVSAAAGFGLLLLTGDGSAARTTRATAGRLPVGAALVAGAVVIALGVGSSAGFVGTAGRFAEGRAGLGAGGGAIGLNPFTSLRGRLERTTPVELLRVRGLDRPTYLRALTLSRFVPGLGWRATAPAPGSALPGPVQPRPATPGDVLDVRIENRAYQDFWLPLYGVPLQVDELPADHWAYDARSGTGYSARGRAEDGWRQLAFLPNPTAAALRAAEAPAGVAPEYLDTTGLTPAVADLTRQVVAGRGNAFDRAVAVQDFFTGPESSFRYSLETAAPGSGEALEEFLTVGRAGYCEQFASAMAVMLRSVGVPARVAVGFTAGIDDGDHRSIRTSDAHAWVEAFFPGSGWTTFDPTPLTDGRTIVPPYLLEARAGAGTAGLAPAEDDPGPDPGSTSGATPAPTPAEPRPETGTGPAPAGRETAAFWPVALLAAVALAAFAPMGVRAVLRRRRLAAVAAGGPTAAGAGWAELLAESTDRGVPSPPTDTVRGAARRLVREHRLDGDAQDALRSVIGTVESSWYGGADPVAAELDGPVRAVRAAMAAGSGLSLRARLFPRSLRTGARSGSAADR